MMCIPSLRRVTSRRFTRVCLTLALAAAGTGCGKRETKAQAGVRTKTLLVGNLAEPRDLDPQVITIATDFNIVLSLFEGLTVFDEKTGRPTPGVATRWDVSADALTYTFHLRPDARWSNGDQVTARDFVYSYQRILTPAFAAEYAYMLWPIKNAEAFTAGKITDFSAVGVSAIDDLTLRITLERPTPYLLSLTSHLSWMPVHRATIEKFGRMDQSNTGWTRPGNLVGNGAFILKEWKPNAYIAVVKNEKYWDAARNHLNGVTFFPIENADAEERDYRSGQLHVTYSLPKQKIRAYLAQPATPLRVEPLLNTSYVTCNVAQAPLDNAKVRRALMLAINRSAIAHSVSFDVWKPAYTFTPPKCGDYTGPSGLVENTDEARRLLADAGFPAGKGFPTLPVILVNTGESIATAEMLQAMWRKELGVNVTLEPAEQKVCFQTLTSKNYSLCLGGWIADYPDPTTFLDLVRTGNGNNNSQWSNRDYDARLDRAAATLDPAARFDLLRDAETLMLTEAPIIPVAFAATAYLVSPSVKNWNVSPLGIHPYQWLDLEAGPMGRGK